MFLREHNGRARPPEIEYDALSAREPKPKRRLVSTEACPPRRVQARKIGGSAPECRNGGGARPAGTQRPKVES